MIHPLCNSYNSRFFTFNCTSCPLPLARGGLGWGSSWAIPYGRASAYRTSTGMSGVVSSCDRAS
ncbi:hypothetical protein NG791_18015 [Laspinema sp. D1]|nr:hypothetical protein [Laspinema sp. D2b]